MTVQEERLKRDCNEFINKAIEVLKDEYTYNPMVAGYNGIVSLLQYAKESHECLVLERDSYKKAFEELHDMFVRITDKIKFINF